MLLADCQVGTGKRLFGGWYLAPIERSTGRNAQAQESASQEAYRADAVSFSGLSGIELNLRRLRAALAVASEGSIVKAASAIHRSPTATTRAVLELEAQLGFPVFDRSRRGLIATEAGHLVLRRLQRAYAHLQLAQQEMAADSLLAQKATHRQLEVVAAVAEHGTETRAAASLGISQPAVTRTLRDLEAIAKQRLFERTPRGMVSTEQTNMLVRRVKLALAEMAAVGEDLAERHGRVQGSVSIGVMPSSAAVLLSPALRRLRTVHPELRVKVSEGTQERLRADLMSGEIDVLVGAMGPPEGTLKQEAIFQDELVLLVRAGHRLALQKDLSLAQVSSEPLIVPTAGTAEREHCEHLFLSAKVGWPQTAIETASATLLRAMLFEDDYVVATSRRLMHADIQSGQVAVLALNGDVQSHTIGVTLRRDASPTPGLRSLLEHLRAVGTTLQPPRFS